MSQQNSPSIALLGGDEHTGNVFVVETKAPAGYELKSHRHKHPHLSVLVSGTVDLTIGEYTQRREGYQILPIPAGVPHGIKAITDVVWLCLWDASLAPRKEAEDSLKLINSGHAPSACASCPGGCTIK